MFLGRANTDTPLSSVVGRSCAATTVPLADSMLIDDDDDDDDDEDDEEVLSFGAGGLSLRESGYIRSFSPLSSARAGLRSSSVPRPTTTAATTTTTSPSSMTATMTTATTATTTTSNITPPSTPSPPPLPAFEHTPTMSLSQSFTAPSTPLRPEPLQRTGSSTSPQRAALSQSTGGRSFMTQRLSQEFRMLPKPPASRKEAFHVFASAINPENTVKNRYPDVLPYEDHRVRLQTGDSDYINASYIPGVHSRSYISCQAPLPHTFGDFWRMIWENDIPLIIMLTKFMEKRQIKAHCYWPQELGSSETFGDVTLLLAGQSAMEEQQITLRTFIMTHRYSSEAKEVAHIHYTEWPDFGVPVSTRVIRRVIALMDQYQQLYPVRPIVAHCSAGIGRTGTLLAVHSFLSRHSGEAKLTVKEIVEDMRAHRMGMVQTKEQYSFIYQTIEDALTERSQMNNGTTPPNAVTATGSLLNPSPVASTDSNGRSKSSSWRTRSSPAIRTSGEIGAIPS